jgi:hypothetical protein
MGGIRYYRKCKMVLLEQTVMCVTGDVVDGVNGGRKFFSNNILD